MGRGSAIAKHNRRNDQGWRQTVLDLAQTADPEDDLIRELREQAEWALWEQTGLGAMTAEDRVETVATEQWKTMVAAAHNGIDTYHATIRTRFADVKHHVPADMAARYDAIFGH